MITVPVSNKYTNLNTNYNTFTSLHSICGHPVEISHSEVFNNITSKADIVICAGLIM